MNLKVLQNLVPGMVLDELQQYEYIVNSKLRMAHFLSQCSHKSGGFKRVEENLNYSSSRLLVVFSKYFTPEQAEEYARRPINIGSRVYANRNGNGDEESKDGYKYRGRGYIQLTGKRNYEILYHFVGYDVVSYPDLVAIKYPLASAICFFQINDLWEICDRGYGADTVAVLAKRISGNLTGLDARVALFNEFYDLLKD